MENRVPVCQPTKHLFEELINITICNLQTFIFELGVLVQEMDAHVRPWKAPLKARIESLLPSPKLSFDLRRVSF